jgi:hypothetical protein
LVTAKMPTREGAELLEQLGVLGISASTLDRIPKRISAVVERDAEQLHEEIRVAEIDELPKREEVARIVVSLDGAMVPMKDGVLRSPSEQNVSARAYREASAGVVQLLDSSGKPLHTLRFARMPEAHKVALRDQILGELKALRLRYPRATIHAIADGAAENWRIFDDVEKALGFPLQSRLVDFYHASEYLAAACKAAEVNKTESDTLRQILRDRPGGANHVLADLGCLQAGLSETTSPERRETVRKAVVYFANNIQKMDYAATKAAGLPIGSGHQEAACKTLIVQRLKNSGMSWLRAGGQAILTLRSWFQSGRYDIAWDRLYARFEDRLQPTDGKVRKKPSYAVAT